MTMRLKLTLAALALGSVVGACAEQSYEFERLEAGEADEARAPRAKTDGQFIRSAYGDLLGRSPGQLDLQFVDEDGVVYPSPLDEEEYLLFVLDGAGDSESMRAMIVAGLVDNEDAAIPDKAGVEDPAGFVTDRFRELLGREPSSYELDSFVRAWNEDEAVGPRVIVRALMGSREYQSQ